MILNVNFLYLEICLMKQLLQSGQWEEQIASSVGTHCILELYGCPATVLNDAPKIQHSLREASRVAKSTLLGEIHHAFAPHGVTALALLAESHISVHTWPETGYAAVDVFTCGDHTMPEKACVYLVEALEAANYTLQTVARRPPAIPLVKQEPSVVC
jgi:S-adenosylmethionine decarboxylase